MVKLFDIQNGKIVPTEHCYTLKTLKDIMELYPEDFVNVYAYLFYMSCPNPDLNPFFDVPENDKEELILSQLKVSFSTEDEIIIEALALCKKLYETPTYRAYMGLKSMLDRLARYMETTEIEHGRDGNINSLVNAAAKFEAIRMSFKGAYKDLMEEQKSQVRGGQQLSYDQM
jgi:uncharacterized protein YdgA (DUF945 family)